MARTKKVTIVTPELAFTLWFELGGGVTYAALAERLWKIYKVRVPASTLRKWGSRYAWTKKRAAAQQKERQALLKRIYRSRSTLYISSLPQSEVLKTLGLLTLAKIKEYLLCGPNLLCANVYESAALADQALELLWEAHRLEKEEARIAREQAS